MYINTTLMNPLVELVFNEYHYESATIHSRMFKDAVQSLGILGMYPPIHGHVSEYDRTRLTYCSVRILYTGLKQFVQVLKM